MRDYGEREWVEFDSIYDDTPSKDAMCFRIEDNYYWIPRSLLDPEDENIVEEDTYVFVYLPIWFAEKEGLI